MKLFKTLCLIILLNQTYLLTDNLLAEDVQLSNSMEKLNGYLVNIESYEANFQQSLSGVSRGNSETTSGRFLMKRPDRFRWQINFPYQQTIIADGQSIWTIDNDLEQVTVNEIDNSIANSPIMLISRKNNELEKLFTVVEMESQKELEKFLLKPKDGSSNFEFIQLGFKEGVLQFIELNDSLGQVTSIVMTNIRNNPIIGNHEFIYEEIADFDLIDSREKSDSGD
ncbi:MAG: outer membrane lipoprotein carrier protein [Enterobacterales bacterium]|jgi:outer membrane lipoprotein carrier protein